MPLIDTDLWQQFKISHTKYQTLKFRQNQFTVKRSNKDNKDLKRFSFCLIFQLNFVREER